MPRDDEELAALLGELERTLDELREELDESSSGRRPERRSERDESRPRRRSRRDESRSRRRDDRDESPQPRRERREIDPPGVTDVLRFTEEYTIPTLIATLEATVEALRLFQKLVSVFTPGDRTEVSDVTDDSSTLRTVSDRAATELTDRAGDQLRARLQELRTALDETDLPEEDEPRDIITDARDLTDEIERRVRESSEGVSRSDTERDAVRIDVGGPSDDATDTQSDDSGADETDADSADVDSADADRADADETEADEPPQVDVEAELESIKQEMGVEEDDETGDSGSEGDPDQTPDE